MKYDYKCKLCDHHKEVKHGMNEKPTVTCKCGQIMVRYLTKSPAMHNIYGGGK